MINHGLSTKGARYLLHAGEPLLPLQSGGGRDLQDAEGVQRQRIQEKAFPRALPPHRSPLLLQHGLRVRVGARGRVSRDGCGGTGGARRPGGVAGTVLRKEPPSVVRTTISDVLAPPAVQLSLHLHKEYHVQT